MKFDKTCCDSDESKKPSNLAISSSSYAKLFIIENFQDKLFMFNKIIMHKRNTGSKLRLKVRKSFNYKIFIS